SVPEPVDPPSAPSGNVPVAATSSPRRVDRRRLRRPLIVTALSAAVTLAIGGVIALRSGDKLPRSAPRVTEPQTDQTPPAPVPAPGPAPAPAQQAALPAAAVEPRKTDIVNIEIRVSPPTAKLWIDDAELPGNPFSGSYHSDTVTHHVRVAAPGYITK